MNTNTPDYTHQVRHFRSILTQSKRNQEGQRGSLFFTTDPYELGYLFICVCVKRY